MSVFPQPGDRYGKYRIEKLLGRGGMGAVYSATDTLLGRQVALKIVLPSLADLDDYKARFAREAALLARVRSRHIVQVHEYGEQDEALFLVTELFPDGDLFQWLTTHGNLRPEVALSIVAQCAEALEDAHAVGVVHRDIKPSNILLWDRDGTLIPYLCDFGIAADAETGLTAAGSVVGSFAYMAPERHLGELADARSDLYSLGCLLWAMLEGHAPYGGTDFQVMNSHINDAIPTYTGDDEHADLVNLVLRNTMAKDPAARYASAGELRAEITSQLRPAGSTGARSSVAPAPLPAEPVAPAPDLDEDGHTVLRPWPAQEDAADVPLEDGTQLRPVGEVDVPLEDGTQLRPVAEVDVPLEDGTQLRPIGEVDVPLEDGTQLRPIGEVDVPLEDGTQLRPTPESTPESDPVPAMVVDVPAPEAPVVDSTPGLDDTLMPGAIDFGARASEPPVEDALDGETSVTMVRPDALAAARAEAVPDGPAVDDDQPEDPPTSVRIDTPATPTRVRLPHDLPTSPEERSEKSGKRKGLLIAAALVLVVGGGAGAAVALGGGGGDKDPGPADGGSESPTLAVPSQPTAAPGDLAVTFTFTAPSQGELMVSFDNGATFEPASGNKAVARTSYGGQQACVVARVEDDGATSDTSRAFCGKSRAPTLRAVPDSACTAADRAGRGNTPCSRYSLVMTGFPAGAALRATIGGECGRNADDQCTKTLDARPGADGKAREPAAVRVFQGNTVVLTVTGGKASARTTFTKR